MEEEYHYIPSAMPPLQEVRSCLAEEDLQTFLPFIDTLIVIPFRLSSEEELQWVGEIRVLGYDLKTLLCSSTLDPHIADFQGYLLGNLSKAELSASMTNFVLNFIDEHDWDTIVDNAYTTMISSSPDQLSCVGRWIYEAQLFLNSDKGQDWFLETFLNSLMSDVDIPGLLRYFTELLPESIDAQFINVFIETALEEGTYFYAGILGGLFQPDEPPLIVQQLLSPISPTRQEFEAAIDQIVTSISTNGVDAFVTFITKVLDTFGEEGKEELAFYFSNPILFKGIFIDLFDLGSCIQ